MMALGIEVGLFLGHIELDGDRAPPTRGTTPPQFLAHVYCGQTAVCIKIPLGTEVGLSIGDIVLHGTQFSPKAAQPQFSAHVYRGETAGWMKTPLGIEVDLGPGHTV